MKNVWLLAFAMPLMAAAPLERPITLAMPFDPGLSLLAPGLAKSARGLAPAFAPAPLPNRDLSTPLPRASSEPTLAPTLFTSHTQFRGDGFSPGSTAQSDQERRTKPGAGFSLHMPLSPQ